MPDQFEQYYKYLKANGADVAPDFNSFKNTLSDYNNASKYYSYLKENQFDVPATYDSFADTFGLKKKDGGIASSPTVSQSVSKSFISSLPEQKSIYAPTQKIASESTRVVAPKETKLISEANKRGDQITKEAIANSNDLYLKSQNKGGYNFTKEDPSILNNKKELEQDLKDGTLQVVKSPKTGKYVLAYKADMLKSFSQAWDGVLERQANDKYVAGLSTEDKIKHYEAQDILNQDKYLETAPAGFSGSVGRLLGENAEPLIKLAAMANVGGKAAQAAGATAQTVANAQKFGSFLAFATDAGYSGYANNTERVYKSLRQQDPNGNPVEQMRKAENAGLIGEVSGIGMAAGMTGIFKNLKGAAETINTKPFVSALETMSKHTSKEAAVQGSISALNSIVSDLGAKSQGMDIGAGDILENALESGKQMAQFVGVTGLAMGTLTGLMKVPGYVKAQAKGLVSELPREEVKAVYEGAEANGIVPEGTTDKVINSLNQYDKAKEKLPEGLTEDKKASLTGIQEKIDKLEESKKKLAPQYHDRVDNTIKTLKDRAIKILESKNPLGEEVDNTLGVKGSEEIAGEPAFPAEVEITEEVTPTEVKVTEEVKPTEVNELNKYNRTEAINPDIINLKYDDNGKEVGGVILGKYGNYLTLDRIYFSPEYRGTGLSKYAYKDALEMAKSQGYEGLMVGGQMTTEYKTKETYKNFATKELDIKNEKGNPYILLTDWIGKEVKPTEIKVTEDIESKKAIIEKERQADLDDLKKGIPAMITKKLESDLKQYGFTDAEINKMTPIVANETLIDAKYKAKLSSLEGVKPEVKVTEQVKPTEVKEVAKDLVEGESVTFRTQDGDKITGEKVILPGYEDMDMILVKDGFENKIYELSSGLEIGGTQEAFSKEAAIKSLRKTLEERNITSGKVHNVIFKGEKVKQINPSKKFESYAEERRSREKADYEKLPLKYSPEEIKKLEELKKKSIEFGIDRKTKEIGDAILSRSRGEKFKAPIEYYEKLLQKDIDEKIKKEYEAKKEPYPKEYIEQIPEPTNETIKRNVNQSFKKDKYEKIPDDVKKIMLEGYKKNVDILNKYGYYPYEQSDAFFTNLLRFMGTLGSRENRESKLIEARKKLISSLEEVRKIHEKEFGKAKQEEKAKEEKTFAQKDLDRAEAKRIHSRVAEMDPPSDAEQVALRYLSEGGKVSQDAINEVSGTTKRASLNTGRRELKTEEAKARDYAGGKESLDDLAHRLWEASGQEISERDIKNALMAEIGNNNSRLDASKAYLERYNIEYQEEQYYERFIEEREEQHAKVQEELERDLRKPLEEEIEGMSSEEHINNLIKQYEAETKRENKQIGTEGKGEAVEEISSRDTGKKAPEEAELAKEYKEAVSKVSKKAKENAKKDFVDRNFDNLVEKLKIQIKCPT